MVHLRTLHVNVGAVAMCKRFLIHDHAPESRVNIKNVNFYVNVNVNVNVNIYVNINLNVL
jgi:hypothetical protein